jgi:hypothetical protein
LVSFELACLRVGLEEPELLVAVFQLDTMLVKLRLADAQLLLEGLRVEMMAFIWDS